MRGVAVALVALGVADLVWINAELGPRAFPTDAIEASAIVADTDAVEAPPRDVVAVAGAKTEADATPDPSPKPKAVPSPQARPEGSPQPRPQPRPEAEPQGRPASELEAPARVGSIPTSIAFETSGVRLDETSAAKLTAVIDTLAANPKRTVHLTGHADTRGHNRVNYQFGLRRARAVKRHLVRNGISADRIAVTSQGELKPRVLGDDESAHRKNRRVEISISSEDSR